MVAWRHLRVRLRPVRADEMLTIVFDLDGTLVDTAPDLIATLNRVLADERLPAIPYDMARPLIGGGARGMIERALAAEGRVCTTAEVDRLYTAFVAHYAAHLVDQSRLFPEVAPTLDRLAGDGYRLAVCTNKLESLAKRLLETLEIAQRFAAICGQDTFGIQKPDPSMFRQTVLRAGGEPTRSTMVGDSIIDIRTARAARVPIVAVDFGYTDVPIATFKPDHVISSFADLPGAVAALANGQNAMDAQHFIGHKS
jgi:phosphoglycolate phosphatase